MHVYMRKSWKQENKKWNIIQSIDWVTIEFHHFKGFFPFLHRSSHQADDDDALLFTMNRNASSMIFIAPTCVCFHLIKIHQTNNDSSSRREHYNKAHIILYLLLSTDFFTSNFTSLKNVTLNLQTHDYVVNVL
jgi:hypothetical protein